MKIAIRLGMDGTQMIFAKAQRERRDDGMHAHHQCVSDRPYNEYMHNVQYNAKGITSGVLWGND